MLEKLRARVSTVVDDGRNLLREIDFFRDIPNRPVPDYIRDRREYSRKINEDYFAWYNAARPIVQAHLPESFDYFEQMFLNSLEKARNLLGTSVDSTYRNDAMLRDLEDAVATQLGIGSC